LVFLFPKIFNFWGMQYKFSQNLRSRLIEYFLKYHSLTISEEQADEYLDSLADLYLCFNSLQKK